MSRSVPSWPLVLRVRLRLRRHHPRRQRAGASPRAAPGPPSAGRTASSGCRGTAPRASRPAGPGRSAARPRSAASSSVNGSDSRSSSSTSSGARPSSSSLIELWWISLSRARLASSSGAARTSSSSCLIMLPMRMTLAGCSTMSVTGRSRLAVSSSSAGRRPMPSGPPRRPAGVLEGSSRRFIPLVCPITRPARCGGVHSRRHDSSATIQVRWVSKSRAIWLTLEEMHKRGEPARPPVDYTKRDDPVTMNNDTPQVFGDDTHDHPRDAYPHHPRLPSDQDGEDFPPFRGWGERVEPVAPDDEYAHRPSLPTSPRPTSWSIGTGRLRGSRVTRRVPATPRTHAMRGTWGTRPTRERRTWRRPATRDRCRRWSR